MDFVTLCLTTYPKATANVINETIETYGEFTDTKFRETYKRSFRHMYKHLSLKDCPELMGV